MTRKTPLLFFINDINDINYIGASLFINYITVIDMIKTYKSGLTNVTICGITFRTCAGGRGSYHTTSDEKEQEMLERSPFFGSEFRLERQRSVEVKRPVTVTVEKREETVSNVFMTALLQEARQIIINIRAERGLPAKNMPNAKSVMKAAEELGLRFPNIKVR